jgi:small-conductance mechanosensitive channel
MLTGNLWAFAALLLAIATVLTFVLEGFKRLVRGRVVSWLSRTRTAVDDLIGFVIDRTGFFLVLFATIWVALVSGYAPEAHRTVLRAVGIIALFLQVAQWGMAAVTFAARHFTARATSHAVAATAMTAFTFIARLAIVGILLMAALMNLGVNVTALLAGLGIGGIAVALAVQNVLRDLLGTIHIVVAKPFLIGDLIEVGDYIGTVKSVGLRSTLLTNLPGEELTVPNNCMLDSFLRNHSRMSERRVSDILSVAYSADRRQSALVATLIQQSIESVKLTRFERSHLKRFGAWGFEYEYVYWVESGDYDTYMSVQQDVNLAMLERFERESIVLGQPGKAALLLADLAPGGRG